MYDERIKDLTNTLDQKHRDHQLLAQNLDQKHQEHQLLAQTLDQK